MDQIDLEAATEEENPIMVSDSGKRDNDERLAPRSKDQYPGTDMEEDRRLYDVAQTFIEEVLRAFPKFLEQHLRDKSKRYESLDLVSAQERTVAGSKDNTQHEEHDHSKASIGPIYDTTLASKKTSLVDSLQGCVDAAFSADFTAPIHTTPDNPLQSNNLGHAHLDYRQRVEMMTEEDIEAENEDRRDLRALWRGDKDCSYLEDPWKYIRRGDKRMFDESTNEQRKELQLELIDALFSCKHEPKLDELLDRRLPAIACWISLVGVRLNKAFEEPAAALKQAEVLIECIWVCKSSDPARVCDVLRSCYRRGILDQPSFHDQVDWSAPKAILGTHIAMVRIAIYLLNILHKPAKRPVDIIEDLDGFWSMPLSMVEETMRCRPPEMDLSVDRGTFFAVADFGLRDLQKVGQLRIQWTSYWDEHLELETSGHATTLKLYWFSPTLSRFFQITGLAGSLVDLDRHKQAEEVARSLDLVLNPYGKRKKSRAQYMNLDAPEWLTLFAHEELEEWKPVTGDDGVSMPTLPLSRFHVYREPEKPKFCCEVQDHMEPPYASPSIERITFTQYPFYHHRLRELRSYMDSRQPRGLAALWRDRRNSNLYYTFWFVLIFGVLGMILAFGTLAVAVLQAWGQLQGLHQ